MKLKEAEDHREEFVDSLLMLAKYLSEDPRQPAALFVHIHYEDQTLVRAFRQRPGFNRLQAIGGFECAKAEMVEKVLGK